MPELKGVVPGMGTPFTWEDELDEKSLRGMVEYMINAGVDGLFVLGSAGQGPHMSAEERMRAAEIIMDQNRDRIAIILQCGTANTKSTIELAKHAEKLKPAAIGVLPLYYGKASDESVINHFKLVSQAVPNMKLCMYDNTLTTQFKTTAKFLETLFREVPMVKTCKMSSTDSADRFMWMRVMPKDFLYMDGMAEFLPLVCAMAPQGNIGTMHPGATMAPEMFVDVWRAFERRDYNAALPKLANFKRVTGGAQAIAGSDAGKEIYRLRGIPVQKMPRASTSRGASPEVVQKLAKFLIENGVSIKQPVTV